MRLALIALVVGLFLAPLQATKFYVHKSGSDSNSCATAQSATDSNAKLTIGGSGDSGGMSCLTEDNSDVLEVGSGTYDEEILRGDWVNGDNSWATATIIQGESGQTVTITPNTAPGGEYALEFDGNWVIWDNIDLDCTNVSSQCISVRSISSVQAHHFRIKNSDWCCGPSNGLGFFSDTPLPDNIEIIDNTIHDFGLVEDGQGNTCQFHGIYLSKSNNLAEGNEIYDGNGNGIQLFHSADEPSDNIIRDNVLRDNLCSGLVTGSGDRNKQYNNLIYGNGNRGILSGFGNPADTEIYHNTIFNNGGNCIRVGSGSTGTIIKNNLCWSNNTDQISDGGTSTVANNNLFSTDPLFISETAGSENLDIVIGSPAKDFGADLSGVMDADDDRVGTARPQGTNWDVGSMEFIEETPPSTGSCGSVGAIVITSVTSGAGFSSADASSYATSSITLTADRVAIAVLLHRDSDGGPPTPTATGNGITWTNQANAVRDTNWRFNIFTAVTGSAPSAGAVTFTMGESQEFAAWIIVEGTNIDEVTAIVQAVFTADNSSPYETTLAAFGSSNNATIGFMSTYAIERDITAGSGFTELDEVDVNTGGDAATISFEWRNDNDTGVDFTSTSGNGGIYGAEIARAVAATCSGLRLAATYLGMYSGMYSGLSINW